jgi:hypothetical protein
VVYESHNTEFVDQEFYYESGALVVNQGKDYVVSIGPGVIIQNNSGQMELSFTLISITSDGSDYTSDGTVGVQFRLVNEKIVTTTTWPGLETIHVNITSPAYEAWYDYWARVIPKNDVGDDDYDISIDAAKGMVSVEFRNVLTVNSEYVIVGASLDLT